MIEYGTYITQIAVMPKGDSLFSEAATVITIDDESGGCFLRLKQQMDDPQKGEICITSDEWGTIKNAVERLLEVCKVLDGEVRRDA